MEAPALGVVGDLLVHVDIADGGRVQQARKSKYCSVARLMAQELACQEEFESHMIDDRMMCR